MTDGIQAPRTVRSEDEREAMRRLFLLREGLTFLNHGSFGACPRPVFEAYQHWQLELERQPVQFLGRRFRALMEAARAALAEYVGSAPDELVYVPNTTTAINTVARALPLQAGDEVLGTELEYGAMDRTWRFICDRRRATYRTCHIPLPLKSAQEVVDAIWAAVTSKTRVLFLSHITSLTALVLPVSELVSCAREAGIITVIDGAHAPGQLPLVLGRLGCDYYAGNCHKWLCAPKGSAFLYARRDMQKLLEPLIVSWGWQSDHPGPSRFVDHHEWQGTNDIAAYLTVPDAIAFQREHDWPRVSWDCHQLTSWARREALRVCGLQPLQTDSPEFYRQMVTVPLRPCEPDALQARLLQDHLIEVPVVQWRGRAWMRISVQGYNTLADLHRLMDALQRVLE